MTESDKALAVEQAIENCDHACDTLNIEGEWIDNPEYDQVDGQSVQTSAGYVKLTCDCGWEEEIQE